MSTPGPMPPFPPGSSSSPSSSSGPGAPRPVMHMPMMAGPTPVVVQVHAKPGGLTRAILFVLGLALFAGAFIFGIIVGIGTMLASADYESVVFEETYRSGSGKSLAIVPILGEIDETQASFVHAAVDDIINSSRFAGVILRVDSPGGGVSASDQIWHDIERLKGAGYPVIASFGGLAASGGYYVSCGADAIVAEQTCITGSIGVIAQVLTFGETMQKIGVQPVTIVASGSPEKDVANDPFRLWNDKDRQTIRVMLDSAYDIFFDRVKQGRSSAIKDASALRTIADGRIYTARQAMENGLVDSMGYLDDAVAQMETRCGITGGQANVVMLRAPLSIFSLIGANRAEHNKTLTGEFSGLDGESLRRMLSELSSPRVMYLMN